MFSIRSLISPKGIASDGCDAGILTNSKVRGYAITNSLDAGIQNVDVVLIPHVSKEHRSLYDFALRALYLSIIKNQEVHCFLDIDAEVESAIHETCSRNGTLLHHYKPALEENVHAYKNLRLFKFNSPVLYVSESVNNCYGYEVFLAIKSEFEHAGKKVLAISEDIYNKMVGAHYLQINASGILEDQIFRMNYLVHQLESEFRPDIILIKHPKPLFQYDDKFPFDSGGIGYLLSQAVPGDGCVYCSHFTTFDEEFWSRIFQMVQMRFGYPVLGVHMGNIIPDSSTGVGLGTTYIPDIEIIRNIRDTSSVYGVPFFYVQDRSKCQDFLLKLTDELIDVPFGVIQ